ncbi:hypothetical protein [Geoalkalibacter halelectricus]|nr:hypothetical protein [Geoalkalibacter halelectricus]MDO3380319.1 hypothetical protein [Geoalkalibacter halelectricus]
MLIGERGIDYGVFEDMETPFLDKTYGRVLIGWLRPAARGKRGWLGC